MSCYILVFSLIVMFVMAYVIEEKDILSPFVISVAMYLLSSVVALIYMDKWQFSLSYLTVLIILTALLTYGLGNFFAKNVCNCLIENKKINFAKKSERIDIKISITIIITVILILFLFKTISGTYALSVEAGNTQGYRQMLTYARRRVIATDYSRSRSLNYILLISQALVYIYAWALIKNLIYKKIKKIDFLYILPITLSFLIYAIGTVKRGFVIEWFAYFCMLFLLLLCSKKDWKPLNAVKIILLALSVLILFLILFAVLGLIAGRFGNSSIIDTIAFYIGLSIPSLDEFVKGIHSTATIIGEETLYGVYAILNKMGITHVSTYMSLDFIEFNNVRGNVYTSLRRYINDYGIVGMYVVQFYLGGLFGLLYNIIKRTSNELLIIFYSMFGYALVMQGIDEIFMGKYLSLGTVNLLICMGVIYFLLVKVERIKKLNEDKKDI